MGGSRDQVDTLSPSTSSHCLFPGVPSGCQFRIHPALWLHLLQASSFPAVPLLSSLQSPALHPLSGITYP